MTERQDNVQAADTAQEDAAVSSKAEEVIRGVLLSLVAFVRTFALLVLRPRRALILLTPEDGIPAKGYTQPLTYLTIPSLCLTIVYRALNEPFSFLKPEHFFGLMHEYVSKTSALDITLNALPVLFGAWAVSHLAGYLLLKNNACSKRFCARCAYALGTQFLVYFLIFTGLEYLVYDNYRAPGNAMLLRLLDLLVMAPEHLDWLFWLYPAPVLLLAGYLREEHRPGPIRKVAGSLVLICAYIAVIWASSFLAGMPQRMKALTKPPVPTSLKAHILEQEIQNSAGGFTGKYRIVIENWTDAVLIIPRDYVGMIGCGWYYQMPANDGSFTEHIDAPGHYAQLTLLDWSDHASPVLIIKPGETKWLQVAGGSKGFPDPPTFGRNHEPAYQLNLHYLSEDEFRSVAGEAADSSHGYAQIDSGWHFLPSDMVSPSKRVNPHQRR